MDVDEHWLYGGGCLIRSTKLGTTSLTGRRLQLSFLMFHHVTGIPFQAELHSGAYDDLTLWEQIDEGAQYTPTKKWLVCVPIGLSVHPYQQLNMPLNDILSLLGS